MKLLSLSFDHVNLFEDGAFGIDFFAGDKVPAGDESVTLLELRFDSSLLRSPLFKGGLPCFLPSRQALKIFLLLLLA